MTILPLVIMIGLVIVELGVAMAFLVYFSNLSSYGTRLAQEALFGARSGVNDAILRIIRNKDFMGTYSSITVGRATVTVSVVKDQPDTNQTTITSTGIALIRQKKYQAVVSIDPNTATVSLVSLTEI